MDGERPSNRPKGAVGDVVQGCSSLEMREVEVRERSGIGRRRYEPPGPREEIETEASLLYSLRLIP